MLNFQNSIVREHKGYYYINKDLAHTTICSVNGKRYKYGFNGKEKDNETYGEGNAYDFGARIYDSRLGRWLSLDPLMRKFTSQSPFNFSLNTPIAVLDIDGRDVIIGNISSFNQQGINAIANSTVISNFINQFASKTSGSQFFYGNESAKQTTGNYAPSINLNINSIARASVQGATMIGANQDAQTTFSYTLSDGTTVAAAAYTPIAGVTVISANINLNVLSDNLTPANNTTGSIGNQECVAAAYTSVAITNELYSSVSNFVNILDANTVGGVVNYVAVTAALAGAGPPPVSPSITEAQNDLVTKNSDTQKSPYIQNNNFTGNSFLCRSTFSLGSVIANQAIPSPAGSIANQIYVSPVGLCPPQSTARALNSNCWSTYTPDNLRSGNQTASTTCK